jgi:hypothetical protein
LKSGCWYVLPSEGLRFIPSNENDILLTANNFFSPHNSVCAKLCNPIDFPPNPFCRLEWNKFMVFAGMRSIITKELFLTFNEISRHRSFCSEIELYFCGTVYSEIKFIWLTSLKNAVSSLISGRSNRWSINSFYNKTVKEVILKNSQKN